MYNLGKALYQIYFKSEISVDDPNVRSVIGGAYEK